VTRRGNPKENAMRHLNVSLPLGSAAGASH
jgi:hypothetical protein